MSSHRTARAGELLHRADDLLHGNVEKGSPEPIGAAADRLELADALAATQRQLRSALRRNSRLLTRCRSAHQELMSLKDALEKAREFAFYDELTGLANRRLLLERFNQASALGKRHQQQLALLFLDLDDFKNINDKFGHSIGDSLIRQVAARLCASVRASDTVCRYGGDEFVVLLAEIGQYGVALAVVEELRSCLTMPYDVAGTSIAITLSLGVAVCPDDGETFADLIQRSDVAMYRCKARKRTVTMVREDRQMDS